MDVIDVDSSEDENDLVRRLVTEERATTNGSRNSPAHEISQDINRRLNGMGPGANAPSQHTSKRTLPSSFQQSNLGNRPKTTLESRKESTPSSSLMKHIQGGDDQVMVVDCNSNMDCGQSYRKNFQASRHRYLPPSLCFSSDGSIASVGASANSGVQMGGELGGRIGDNNEGRRQVPSSVQVSKIGSRSQADHNRNYIGESSHSSTKKHDNFLFAQGSASSKGDVSYQKAGAYRVLPSSLMYSKFGGTSQMYSASTMAAGEERRGEHDEREIYREVVQNLGQYNLQKDVPEGLLTVTLLKHQKIALSWMVQREQSSHCSGGFLADDQGLGKTVSMIALIQNQISQQTKFTSSSSNQAQMEALNLDEDDDAVNEADKEHQSEKDGEEKKLMVSKSYSASRHRKPEAGTLVVCPASVLRQWARELEEKVSERAKLSVLVYHGCGRTKDPGELAKYHVVLTTYTIVTNEVPKQFVNDDDEEGKSSERCGISSEFSIGKKRKQNSKSGRSRKKGKSSYECCFEYGRGPLAKVRWFRVVLDEAQTIKNHRTQVARACCSLRAKRRWCLSGTPIQNTIDDLFSYFRFLKYQPYSEYSLFCERLKQQISRDSSLGYKKLQAVLKPVLLRRTKGSSIDGQPIIDLPPKKVMLEKVNFAMEERAFYAKLETESRRKFKAYAAAGTLRENYASILLMLLRLRQACGHPSLVKGYHSGAVGTESLDTARQLPKDILINLLNELKASLAICGVCEDPPDDAVVAMCGHVFCYQCISEHVATDDNTCPVAGCKNMLDADSIFSEATLKSCLSGESDNKANTSSEFGEELPIEHSGYTSSKIKAALEILTSICVKNAENEELNESYVCQAGEGDLINGCLEPNETAIALTPRIPIKAIVFSQWTGMLDLVEMALNRHLIQYRRLDGTMSLAARDKAVKDFNTDPEVIVMLMSLKAGNLGLNMAAACHVILLDLWWNPTTEDQAVDRAHRIGQTRPVTVTRLTIKDTVEDRILALQEEKRNMVSSAFGEDQKGRHTTRLTVDDLSYLFNVGI